MVSKNGCATSNESSKSSPFNILKISSRNHQDRSKAQMKGVTIGDSLGYKLHDGEFHGMPLLFAEPKGKVATPRSLSVTASNLTSLLQRPTVFFLSKCTAYEWQRLIDKDIYFVASDKYISNRANRINKTKTQK